VHWKKEKQMKEEKKVRNFVLGLIVILIGLFLVTTRPAKGEPLSAQELNTELEKANNRKSVEAVEQLRQKMPLATDLSQRVTIVKGARTQNVVHGKVIDEWTLAEPRRINVRSQTYRNWRGNIADVFQVIN